VKQLLTGMIKAYKKFVSPYFARSCRFAPTCSEYAAEAVEKFGALKGSAMAAWRILRCNPFSRGGYDPVVKEIKEEK
jgi:putative membrane protein insertion efficiency factor